MRPLFFACAVLLGAATFARADWVVLKDKSKFAGTVTQNGDTVEVKAADGAVRTFKKDEVERVLDSPRDIVHDVERACAEAQALFEKGGEAADPLGRNQLLKQAVARLEGAYALLERYREIFPEPAYGYLDTALLRVVKSLKVCRERMIAEGKPGAGEEPDLPVSKSRDELLADLRAPEANTRRLAALALGRKREEKALPDLVRHLRDEADGAVREAVCQVLGKAPAPPIVRTIDEELKSGTASPAFTGDACTVLERLGTPEAMDLVLRIESSCDPAVRPRAVAALRARRAIVAKKLGAWVNESNPEVRKRATDLLIEVGGPEAARVFLPLLVLPDELKDQREAAAAALRRLGGHAVPVLVDALLDEMLREQAHALLAEITHQTFAAGEVLKWQKWLEENRAELLK